MAIADPVSHRAQARPAAAATPPMRVLVVLPRNLDAGLWAQRCARGEVPDETPYGYHFARRMGCEVVFSRPTPTPGGLAGLFDKAFRRLLGFDIRHIWANRDLIADAGRHDCVWTHTENEHLAIGLLKALLRAPHRVPPLIAQSIWLADEWPRWSRLRRALYRRLMRDAEVHTVHSPLNAQVLRDLRLGRRVEIVEFGISLDSFPGAAQPPAARARDEDRPVRVFALGNDRHRDWACLAEALGGRDGYEVRIGSSRFPGRLAAPNLQAGPMTQAEVMACHDWADCCIIPLRHNLHVSGMTTVLEAVAMGMPVLAARAGGLPHYFDDRCVTYYDAGDPDDLRRQLDALMSDPARRLARAQAARQTLLEREFTSEGFARRHVRLTRTMLSSGPRENTDVSARNLLA